jgi:hypothetical protein
MDMNTLEQILGLNDWLHSYIKHKSKKCIISGFPEFKLPLLDPSDIYDGVSRAF